MAQKTSWTGATLTESDINTYLMGEGGAWTTWTPVVTQSGAVAVTVNRAVYARYGRTIHWKCQLTVTGTGTASQPIYVSVPVTGAAATDSHNGSGYLFDTSAATFYPCVVVAASTTTTQMLGTAGTNPTLGAGGGFTAALAAGDQILLSGTYEAAS
jgi:hypothetical protein